MCMGRDSSSRRCRQADAHRNHSLPLAAQRDQSELRGSPRERRRIECGGVEFRAKRAHGVGEGIGGEQRR